MKISVKQHLLVEGVLYKQATEHPHLCAVFYPTAALISVPDVCSLLPADPKCMFSGGKRGNEKKLDLPDTLFCPSMSQAELISILQTPNCLTDTR